MKPILKGKVAFITGASSGIGRGLAVGFANLGADIVIAARDQDRMNVVKTEVENEGQKAITVKCDVQDYDSVKNAIDKAVEHMEKIDILVNNAGYSKLKPIIRMKVGEFQDILKTNVLGVYNVTHAMVPHMDKQGGGCIINTGSLAAKMAMPKWSAYAMSKSALLAFTESLAAELKRNKITVNTIMPNMVDTPLLRQGLSQEDIERLNPMVPGDLVPYYAFIGSKRGKRMSGVNVNVDVIENILSMKEELSEEDKQSKINWKKLKGMAKEKLKDSEYRMAGKSRRLIDFLLSIKE